MSGLDHSRRFDDLIITFGLLPTAEVTAPSPNFRKVPVPHLQSERYEEAIVWADRALIQKPGFLNAMITRRAACGHLDRQAEGSDWVGRMREIAPRLTVKGIGDFLLGFFLPAAVAFQTDGLRAAGLPED